ncbi:MAG: hypothetical protein HY094_01990 [Candidatus Melainabacteria bacterium]|nr:hypothetical protein [Candidatus Melainabacteria bacterium]
MVGKLYNNTAFLEKTIKVWQPYSEKPLTFEDAREIIHNTVGAYKLLIKWEMERQKKSNATGEKEK